MIYETLEILKDQVSLYLEGQLGDSNLVVLENIAKLDDPDVSTMNDKVVLSLLNIQEIASLKNKPNIQVKNGQTVYLNKPINLDVFVLFSVNRSGYDKSLTALSSIIEFFQSKKVFDQTNTPLNPTIIALNDITEFRFTIDLHTQSLEQLNYVWGALGGKSLPNVMYKLRLLKIERGNIQDVGTPITEVIGSFSKT